MDAAVMHTKHDAACPHSPLPARSPDRFLRSAHSLANSVEHSNAPGHDACQCVVCEQLDDIDMQYFGRVLRNDRARSTLVQTFALGMGFCPAHAARAAALHGNAADTVRDSIRDAKRHLGELLDRTALQDELMQDIMFGARGRCPACTYVRRVEGRVLARVQRAFEQQKPSSPPPMCFVHLQSLMQRIEPRLLGRTKRLLRARSLAVLHAIDLPHVCHDDRMTQACRHLCPFEFDSGGNVPAEHCDCPICEDVAIAQRRWLGTAVDNVRLRQPGWIALPTCHRHLLQCMRQPDPDLQHAALARYFEVTLPGRPVAAPSAPPSPKRRRRKHARWFDPCHDTRHEHDASQGSEAQPRESCPGCDAQEIAARKSVARLIRNVSRAEDDDALARAVEGVCLKHFAEAFIYASEPRIEQRLRRALGDMLRRDGETRECGAGRHALDEC
ncbi:hypothetical protein J4G52_36825 [Burkholderia cenocepacia]|uniref:hypothetical protein n=1 Tax=Burkholderia cenocepacia TaxID=95486 RepID=UPI001AA11485|nr:hypothetical protein [Burkholderia cenocepacia]MBO1859126.1 hypothetical protein [Burkholderia cenocepacia]MDR5645949.1 hypothetical protein [Burkholderia cenocepacia]